MKDAVGIFFASLLVVFVIAAIAGVAFSLPDRRRRRAEREARYAANLRFFHLIDVPTPEVPIVPGEVVDELPLRAQAIELPREGAVLQGTWTVHDECLDAWSARDHEGICGACAPVFGKAVKA